MNELKKNVKKRARKMKKEALDSLYVFNCHICGKRTADPDGILYRAIYCPACGSGLRSSYEEAGSSDRLRYKLDLGPVFWEETGFFTAANARKGREAAALVALLREEQRG